MAYRGKNMAFHKVIKLTAIKTVIGDMEQEYWMCVNNICLRHMCTANSSYLPSPVRFTYCFVAAAQRGHFICSLEGRMESPSWCASSFLIGDFYARRVHPMPRRLFPANILCVAAGARKSASQRPPIVKCGRKNAFESFNNIKLYGIENMNIMQILCGAFFGGISSFPFCISCLAAGRR